MNIAILGANGTMGKNAAAMFASFGKAEKVYLALYAQSLTSYHFDRMIFNHKNIFWAKDYFLTK